MHIITIYYRTNDIGTIRKIQKRFRFPRAMTINGTWPVMVADEDWELLQETERRGYVNIRHNANIERMKATKLFIDTIEAFLKKEAETDREFAKKMQEQPEKTPEVVCDYILAEVSKAKRSGWADEEIYGMARHFIDEKELKKPGTNSVTRVVVNTHVDLSEEEKEEVKKEAVKRYQEEVKMKAEEEAARKAEREKAREEKRRKELEAKREKENAMQGDLFGGQW